MKRIFALIIVALMIIPLLTACSSGSEKGTSATNAAVGGETTAPETVKEYGYYKDKNFEGRDFKFLNAPAHLWNMYCTMLSEEMTGETINDAIYERNSFVCQQLNCKLSEEEASVNDTTLADKLVNAITAGDDVYNVGCIPLFHVTRFVTGNYIYNLDEVSSIHLDENYWNQTLLTSTSLNNRHYIANSPAHFMAIDAMWMLFFNESMMTDLKLTYPYDLVREGKWTLDRLEEFMKAGAMLNGDTEFIKTTGDSNKWDPNGKSTYGLTSSSAVYHKLLYGVEAPLVTKDKDDKPTFGADSEHWITAAQRLAGIMSVPGQYMEANNDAKNYHYSKHIFVGGRTLFMGGEMKEAQVCREMEDEFGIVPFPKWDEQQASYHTTLSWKTCTFSIPVSEKDPTDVGLLLDALSYESNENILDLFFGNRIEAKGLRNENSVEMLHIIYDCIGVDLGDAFDLGGKILTDLKTYIPNGNTAFSSLVASNKETVIAKMNDILTFFK